MPRPKLPPVIKVPSMPAQLGARLTAAELAQVNAAISSAIGELNYAQKILARLEGKRK